MASPESDIDFDMTFALVSKMTLDAFFVCATTLDDHSFNYINSLEDASFKIYDTTTWSILSLCTVYTRSLVWKQAPFPGLGI